MSDVNAIHSIVSQAVRCLRQYYIRNAPTKHYAPTKSAGVKTPRRQAAVAYIACLYNRILAGILV
jgi:hypothetical protein